MLSLESKLEGISHVIRQSCVNLMGPPPRVVTPLSPRTKLLVKALILSTYTCE